MTLRVAINDQDSGVVPDVRGICYVVVNWLVGAKSEDTFLAATVHPKFQSLRPGDSITVRVAKQASGPVVQFDGSIGAMERRNDFAFGYDVAVNGGITKTVRVARGSSVASALVFVNAEENGGRLSIVATGMELLSFALAEGQEVRIKLSANWPRS